MAYENFFNLTQFNVKPARGQTKSTKSYPNSTIQPQSLYRGVCMFFSHGYWLHIFFTKVQSDVNIFFSIFKLTRFSTLLTRFWSPHDRNTWCLEKTMMLTLPRISVQYLVLLKSSPGNLDMQPGAISFGCSLLFLKDFSIFCYTENTLNWQIIYQRV